jgi:hypothetical protein
MLTATFTDGVYIVTVTGLTQWDYGQQLTISGITLAGGTEVHFANSEAATATVKEISGGVVEIPDAMLQQPHDIKAYIFEKTDGSETVRTVLLPSITWYPAR